IGDLFHPILIANRDSSATPVPATVTANISGTGNFGNVFVKNTNNTTLTVGASSAGGTLSFANDGGNPASTDPPSSADIIVNGNLGGIGVTLSTFAPLGFNNGNVIITAGKTITGTSAVAVFA